MSLVALIVGNDGEGFQFVQSSLGPSTALGIPAAGSDARNAPQPTGPMSLVALIIGDDSRGFQRYREILRATRSWTNKLHGFMNNGRFGAYGPDMKKVGAGDRRNCI